MSTSTGWEHSPIAMSADNVWRRAVAAPKPAAGLSHESRRLSLVVAVGNIIRGQADLASADSDCGRHARQAFFQRWRHPSFRRRRPAGMDFPGNRFGSDPEQDGKLSSRHPARGRGGSAFRNRRCGGAIDDRALSRLSLEVARGSQAGGSLARREARGPSIRGYTCGGLDSRMVGDAAPTDGASSATRQQRQGVMSESPF